MKPVIFHPDAQAELAKARDEYEEKREGLGDRYLEETERVLEFVSRHPKAFGFFRQTHFRRRPLKRFPFVVFYRELEDVIFVIAVAHGHRRPGYWLDRGSGDTCQ